MMDDEYSLYKFTEVSRVTGTLERCRAYVAEHGGTIYTQVDCDEYTDEDGSVVDMCYVQGEQLVNRTGWYGVA